MTYEDLLWRLCQDDPRLVVMTAENRATIRGLPARLGPRFIDVGIAEMTLVGAAAGLALRGRVPVVHALAAFLTLRAYEFVRTDVGIAHLPVKLVGFVPGFLSTANGPTHQAIEDVAVMRQIPGMRVFSPSDRDDLLAGLPAVIADPHPWYIRYNDQLAAMTRVTAPPALGTAELLREGSDVTLLSHGLLVGQAAAAARLLADHGVEARVLNMRTLAPADTAAILAAARQTSLLVTIEDHLNTGGLYGVVCEALVEANLACPVLPLGLNSWFKPTLLDHVLTHEGFTPEAIAARILNRWHSLETIHA